MTDSTFDTEAVARAVVPESAVALQGSHAPPSHGACPRERGREFVDFLGEGRRAPMELEMVFRFLDRGAGSAARETIEMIAPRNGDDPMRICLQYAMAAARLICGPPAPVLRDCAAGLRALGRGGAPLPLARFRALAFRAYRRAEDPRRARRCLNRLRETAARDARPELAILVRACEAELLRDERRHEAAISAYRDLLAMLGAGAGRTDLDPRSSPVLRGWAETLLVLGRVEEAKDKCRQAVLAASRHEQDDPVEHGRALHLEARLALEDDDEERIFHFLDRAENELRRAGSEEDLASLLLFRGETILLRIADSRRRECAVRNLQEARGILWRIGRARDWERCELLLDAARRANGGSAGGAAASGARRLPRVPRSRRLTHLGFLTCDPGTLRALEPLESLGRTSIPVLILGETGTGKEVLARALHRGTGFRGPFVPVNCGALPADLQESELFGHVRGAFTGAIADKIGLFEAANGGTLLLDEVGEMSPRAQVKLLRVLELGEVRRVGETRTRKVQVRVVAATNVDLISGIRSGAFRLDLYYRLCGLSIQLPPLRDRMADVPLLASHFARLFWDRESPAPLPSTSSVDRLLRHDWPGNVRELRFTMERAMAWTAALERETVEPDVIEFDAGTVRRAEEPDEEVGILEQGEVARAGGLEAYLTRTERRLILQALEKHGWNRARAARSLGGMSRTTLIGKMKRLGLFPDRCDAASADGRTPLGF